MPGRLGLILLPLALAGCVTPLAPDPTIDPRGRWTIVAVDGEPTDGGRNFHLVVADGTGRAQFGCNDGGGALRVAPGWLVPGDWIMTAAGCLPKSRHRFERKGFTILGHPVAVEARPAGGIRLRNREGSIDLVRITESEFLAGRWNVVRINSEQTHDERFGFSITFTPTEFQAYFGCNGYRGSYSIDRGHLLPRMSRSSEKGCFRELPSSVPLMTLEEWAFETIRKGPRLNWVGSSHLTLTSGTGEIELARLR